MSPPGMAAGTSRQAAAEQKYGVFLSLRFEAVATKKSYITLFYS
jgi:hypothetical protein